MLDSSGIVNDCELDLVAAFHHLLDFHIPLKVDGDWARWRLGEVEIEEECGV